MRYQHVLTLWVVLLIALVASVGSAQADAVFTVNLNTSALMGLAGPFAVAFQLTDGSALGDANNTATITNFAFGGGSAAACPPAVCTVTGGASGDMTGTVTLTDSDFFNSFAQGFTVGNSLSFQVDLTTNVDVGGTPDAFAFSLLDNGNSIPTLDPLGADSLLSVDIDSANPAILTWATDTTRTTISLAAPEIGTPPSPPQPSLPQPGTLLLIVTGLAGMIGMGRRRFTKHLRA